MAKGGRRAWGWRFLAGAAAAIAFVPVALWWLRLLGAVPDATPPAGIEFVPPSWLLVAVVPAVLLLIVARLRITAGVLLFAWLAVALFRGDHALGARGEPPAEGGADLALLEWNVQGVDVDAIAARLRGIRPDVAILAGGTRDLSPALGERLGPWRVLDGGPGSALLVTPHRILASRTVALPNGARGDARRLLHAELEVAGARVHALALDLATGKPLSLRERLELGGVRAAARDAGARFLADYVGRLDGPVVLGGDLDAPPSTAAVRRLAGVADDLLLADHPVGLASLGTWQTPVRADYLFVRDLVPVRSEPFEGRSTGRGPLFGVARLPAPGSRPAAAAVPAGG